MRVASWVDVLVPHWEDWFATGPAGGCITEISGSMASGKTALLHAVSDLWGESGRVVMTATASADERHMPLGVLGQLLSLVPSHRCRPGQANRLLVESMDAVGDDGRLGQDSVRRLGDALLALSAEAPVLISVDDAEHADEASLQCLSYVTRRLRLVPIHLMVSVCCPTSPNYESFGTRLRRQPYFRKIELAQPSAEQVGRMMSARLGREVPAELSARCAQISGSNLVLLQALIDEMRDGHGAGAEPCVGRAFRAAVAACLGRCTPDAVPVLCATAVLGDLASPHLVGALADVDAEAAARLGQVLNAMGFTESGRFRHPLAAEVVLASLAPAQHMRLHSRAAELLYQDGAAPAVVARYLAAAGAEAGQWAAGVLLEAAREHRDDNPELSRRYVKLARQISVDDAERGAVAAMLVSLEWQLNPGVAARYLPDAVAAFRDGRLSVPDSMSVIRYLLWHGRLDEAEAALAQLAATPVPADAHVAAEVSLFRLWLSYGYPTLLERVPSARSNLSADLSAAATAATPLSQVVNAFQAVLNQVEPSVDVVALAEQMEQSCRLGESTIEPLITMLLTLIGLDRLDVAGRWCDSLLRDAAARRSATWQAQLSCIRALIASRTGDLLGTVEYAEAALTHTDAETWGARVGGPLACLVFAHTAMGRHDKAVEVLAQPVPTEMYQTVFCLYYLQARGYHYLVTGRRQFAHDDFKACEELATRWQIDLPGLITWRLDLARLHLAAGDAERARAAIRDQLARVQAPRSRTRGVALRLLAATSPPAERPRLLRRSVEILNECGAQLELASAFADLGEAYQRLGDLERARTAKRRSRRLFESCASGLPRTYSHAPENSLELDLVRTLSEAERTVAVLASQGYTNQEISRKLFITISTVEQHLTKAYRKLNIRRRTDLPPGLRIAAC